MTQDIEKLVAELRPCPFCGGTDLKFALGCLIHCRSCCAEGPVFDGVPSGDDFAEAAKLWNARADLGSIEPTEEMVEATAIALLANDPVYNGRRFGEISHKLQRMFLSDAKAALTAALSTLKNPDQCMSGWE